MGAARWQNSIGPCRAVILIDIWQWTPLLMIIFLAGLKSLPVERMKRPTPTGRCAGLLVCITLPLLKTTILVALLLRTMQSLKVFDTIYATRNGGDGW